MTDLPESKIYLSKPPFCLLIRQTKYIVLGHHQNRVQSNSTNCPGRNRPRLTNGSEEICNLYCLSQIEPNTLWRTPSEVRAHRFVCQVLKLQA